MFELLNPNNKPIVFNHGGFYGTLNPLEHFPEQPTFWENLFYVKEGYHLRPRRSEDTLIAILRHGVVINVPYDTVFKTSL